MCLHDWEIINDTRDGILERCKLCGKRLKTSKDVRTERIDNRKYLKEHRRDFLQRGCKDYERVYGKPEERQSDIDEMIQRQKDEADEVYEREKAELKRRGEWK